MCERAAAAVSAPLQLDDARLESPSAWSAEDAVIAPKQPRDRVCCCVVMLSTLGHCAVDHHRLDTARSSARRGGEYV